jgi:NAD(P)-dependent dehydrogenase (short-subunit alcohol dehydrogenase family)
MTQPEMTNTGAMADLRDKVVVVTGAASGIGAAMARRFAAAGARIVLADIDEVRLRSTEAQLAEGGADVLPVVADIALEEGFDHLVQRTLERYGAAHVLCNNAGVVGVGDPWKGPMSVWRWVVEINLYGVVHGIRSFLPVMEEQGEGHIVNTASMAGLLAMPGAAPYNATKSAVVALSEGLYLELAAKQSPVSVSVLCPGFVRTSLMDPDAIDGVRWSSRLGDRPTDTADPIGKVMDDMLRSGVETGMDADAVADRVVDAVRERRFWILTHDEYGTLPVDRMQRAVDGVNPTFG